MRISDWSSDVCSSDLLGEELRAEAFELVRTDRRGDCRPCRGEVGLNEGIAEAAHGEAGRCIVMPQPAAVAQHADSGPKSERSEEHTSELQSLMRISYAVFCLKNKNHIRTTYITTRIL